MANRTHEMRFWAVSTTITYTLAGTFSEKLVQVFNLPTSSTMREYVLTSDGIRVMAGILILANILLLLRNEPKP